MSYGEGKTEKAADMVRSFGVTQSEAARIYGISRQRVSHHLLQCRNGKKPRPKGKTPAQQIANTLQLSAGRVSQIKKQGCPMHSVEEAMAWIRQNVKIKTKISKPAIVVVKADQIDAGFVYVLIEEKSTAIKIGFAEKCVWRRCRGCQVGNPRKLYVAHFRRHKSARTIEHKLHIAFGHRRLNGEWFDVPLWEVLEELEKYTGWEPAIYSDGASWKFNETNNEQEAA